MRLGVTVHDHFLPPREILFYRLHCAESLARLSFKAQIFQGERTRVRRWGFTYGKGKRPPTAIEPWPGWIEDLRLRVDTIVQRGMSDAITLNEYPTGHYIAPHADSPWFEDEIAILNLGECILKVYDGDPREPRPDTSDVGNPVESLQPSIGALVVMLRPVVHACTATGEDTRYSIVFRKRAINDRPSTKRDAS